MIENPERMVVGALLVNPSAVVTVEAALDPRHFQDRVLRTVYEAVLAVAAAGRPIDLVTVRDELQGKPVAVPVPLLASLVDGVSGADNVEWWAGIVRDRARRRQARKVADALIADLDSGEDTDVVLDRHQGAMARLVDVGARRVVPLSAVLPAAVRNLETYAAAEDGVTGIPTGLAGLDAGLGGLRPGALYVIAARAGRGKSALLAQMATHAAALGRKVLVFSMEMEPYQLAERMLLADAEVDRIDLNPHSAKYEYSWSKVALSEGKLSRLPLWFDPHESPNMAQVRASARQQHAAVGLDLVVVDYLQRLTVDPKLDRWIAVGDLAKGLKSLARSLKVPVVVACQLNADAEEKRPTMAMLGQSQSVIGAEADVVALLHPDDLKEWKRHDYAIVHCLVDKNRWGPSCDVLLSFEKACSRFVPVPKGKARA